MALDIETASRRLAQEQSQLAQAKAALSQAQAEYNQAVASGKIKPGTPEAIEFRRQLNIPVCRPTLKQYRPGSTKHRWHLIWLRPKPHNKKAAQLHPVVLLELQPHKVAHPLLIPTMPILPVGVLRYPPVSRSLVQCPTPQSMPYRHRRLIRR